ncbi:hypothetical protein [Mesotoga sp. UBA5847]|jgi:alpha-tubulin suppressor-like RCC1 family protein|uniref:RCC1 domain-containing protein n=1 Tax=Mesotoga sp. UBA5847 TaxID=1946859 RepID=UPI0025D7A8EB|nr:hypothetical protein [Mesotoga sp. UBA5847]
MKKISLLLLTSVLLFLLLGCPSLEKPPTINIPDQTVDEDQVLQFDLRQHCADENINSLVFKIISGVGQIIGSDYKYSPTFEDSGIKEVKIRVTNSKGTSAENSFRITVIDINRPPVVEIPDQTMDEGETLTLNLNDYANDRDGDTLSFSLVSGVGTVNDAIYTYTAAYDLLKKQIEYNPTAENVVFPVVISANDNKGGETVDSFNVIVGEVNRPPNIPALISPNDGELIDNSVSVVLSWECDDPDGDTVFYDVYLDTKPAPESMNVEDYEETTLEIENLLFGTEYYWKIVAQDHKGGVTESQVRSFAISEYQERGIVWIDAGGSHTVALKDDGRVLSWGSNNYGQLGDGTNITSYFPMFVKSPNGEALLESIVAVAAGNLHTLALAADGTVWAWGSNNYGQLGDGTKNHSNLPVQVKGLGSEQYLTGVVAIAAAGSHSVAVRTDGSVVAWGENSDGCLGDGTTQSRHKPVIVKGDGPEGYLGGIISVDTGQNFTIALARDGTVWAWGGNKNGQLGDGTNYSSYSPVKVKSPDGNGVLSGIIKISVDSNSFNGHVLAITESGSVFSWGENSFGQLGNGRTDDQNKPVQVKGYGGIGYLEDVVAVFCGQFSSFAVTESGVLWSWGNNEFGQLGDGTKKTRYTPVKVRNEDNSGDLENIIFGTASEHSIALDNSGLVWSWGNNESGQLANGTNEETILPKRVFNYPASGFLQDIVGIVAGNSHSIAITESRTLVAWGANGSGNLGNNTTFTGKIPIQVKGPDNADLIENIILVEALGHSVALNTNGEIWTWGPNFRSQLGDGTTVDRLLPVQVRGPNGEGFLINIVEVAAGNTHTVALKEDGTVWSWGSNTYGELGDGTVVRKRTPVQVLGPGGEGFLEGIVKVAAGADYSLALMNDGSVWAWGINGVGQLGNGTTDLSSVPTKVKGPHGEGFLSDIIDIDCGLNHNIALTRDGTLWSWGYNYYGQLGDGTIENRSTPVEVRGPDEIGLMSDVTDIDAGGYSSIALKEDGSIWSWGNNDFGQLGDGTKTIRYSPVQVKGPNNASVIQDIIAVSMGGYHGIALKNDGTVWSWGSNQYCQLGANSTTNRLTPVQVSAPARLDSYLYLW